MKLTLKHIICSDIPSINFAGVSILFSNLFSFPNINSTLEEEMQKPKRQYRWFVNIEFINHRLAAIAVISYH